MNKIDYFKIVLIFFLSLFALILVDYNYYNLLNSLLFLGSFASIFIGFSNSLHYLYTDIGITRKEISRNFLKNTLVYYSLLLLYFVFLCFVCILIYGDFSLFNNDMYFKTLFLFSFSLFASILLMFIFNLFYNTNLYLKKIKLIFFIFVFICFIIFVILLYINKLFIFLFCIFVLLSLGLFICNYRIILSKKM